MRHCPAIALLLGLLSALPSSGWAAAQLAPAEQVRAIIGAPNGENRPGCAVGLFEADRTRFIDAGMADIATGRRFDADTLFYSGSLAKQFTALAVMQLVIAGKLDLNDDVRKFLPELIKPSGAITIAMLLHHTGGIPNDAKLWPLAGYIRPSQATRAESTQILLRFPQTNFPPGATFEYSNGGYELLAEIVERVSGVKFEDYIERSVLRPMGMTRSSVLRGAVLDDANIAHGYVSKKDAFVLSEDLPMFGGAGGLMLTINELARYHHDITVGHRVWTPAITRLMTEAAAYPDGSPVILPVPGYHFGYAAGLMLSRDWVLHGGNFAGFQALIAWRPESGDGIALLCNRGDLQPPKLATKILAALRPDLPPVDAERYDLPALSGRFASSDLPAIYNLRASGEGLTVAISSPDGTIRSTSEFKRNGDGAYTSGPVSLRFDPDQRGFVVTNGANAARFRRAPAGEEPH